MLTREDIEKAVVGIYTSDPREGGELVGTAFFISWDLVLTAAHCIENYKDSWVLYSAITKCMCSFTIKSADSDKDLALLKLADKSSSKGNIAPLAVGWGSSFYEPKQHTEVLAYGYPPKLGEIKLIERSRKFLHYDNDFAVVDQLTGHGMSGGPVMLERKLFGLTRARSQSADCHLLIKFDVINAFVNRNTSLSEIQHYPAGLLDYCQEVIDRNEFLPDDFMIKSLMNRHGSTERLDNRRLYIPLHIESSITKNMKYSVGSKAHTIPSALLNSPRIIIRGGPGSGKSTLSSYWALVLAQQLMKPVLPIGSGSNDEERLLNAGYIPVLVFLNEFFNKCGKAFKGGKIDQEEFSQRASEYVQGKYGRLDWFEQVLLGKEKLPANLKILWLFDGLDEVHSNDVSRNNLMGSLEEWSKANKNKQNIICITTRPYAYQAKYTPSYELYDVQTLPSIDDEDNHAVFRYIVNFLADFERQWHVSHKQKSVGKVAQEFQKRVCQSQFGGLKELVRDPLLLTLAIALFSFQGEEALPDDRAELYRNCIGALLNRWKGNSDSKGKHIDAKSDQLMVKLQKGKQIYPLLNQLAYRAHSEFPKHNITAGDVATINSRLIENVFADHLQKGFDTGDLLHLLSNRTGLVIEPSLDSGLYRFIHRTFREYFAARYLLSMTDEQDWKHFRENLSEDPGWWLETLKLMVKSGDGNKKDDCEDDGEDSPNPTQRISEQLLRALPFSVHDYDPKPNSKDYQVAITVSEALTERWSSEQYRLDADDELSLRLHQRCRHWLTECAQNPDIEPPQRVQAGAALGWIGDRRSGVGLNDSGLPDISWVKSIAPTKPVELEGVDGDGFTIEGDYYLARYPVTNTQFQAFLDADDFADERYWKGLPLDEKAVNQSHWSEPNHPKTDVTWYQAIAYCRWLTALCDRMVAAGHDDPRPIPGGEIRLPDEWEWQWAAAGAEQRKFPWGNEYQEGFANISETKTKEGSFYVQRASAVGIYPKGYTPSRGDSDSWADLAGNAWEWCRNSYKNLHQPWNATLGKEESRVLRGGSWFGTAGGARCAYRFDFHPNFCDFNVGFRLLCSPIREP